MIHKTVEEDEQIRNEFEHVIRERFKKGRKQNQGNSVTRLGDFLHFGQPFKAFGNNKFAQISTFLGNFCKGVKIFQISNEIIFEQLS